MRIPLIHLGALVALILPASFGLAEVAVTNSQNFAAEVIEPSADRTVIVMFNAAWCGPCRSVLPRFNQLADDAALAEQMAFVLVDVDDSPDITAEYGVASLPAYVAFRGGEAIDSATGAGSLDTLVGRLPSP
jgi:thioredoxin